MVVLMAKSPLETSANSLLKAENLKGKGLLMVWAYILFLSTPTPMPKIGHARPSSPRKMFTVDQDTGWIFQYSKPQSPESIYHWSAPRNFANHRVSAHLSLAQHIQEALSPTEDQTSRNSSPKCFGRGLWRSPLACQWPSWWCGHTGSSGFVTSYSWQSPPPSAEWRVTV